MAVNIRPAPRIRVGHDNTPLHGQWAVPAFLTIFKENYNIYGATPTNRAIGAKAAQLATSVAGGEEYFVTLLNNKGDSRDNSPLLQQISAVKALICAHNKTSVRLLAGALDSPIMGGRAANGLATMGLPGAPYSSKDKGGTSSADGIAKWKEWWKSNAANYSGSN